MLPPDAGQVIARCLGSNRADRDSCLHPLSCKPAACVPGGPKTTGVSGEPEGGVGGCVRGGGLPRPRGPLRHWHIHGVERGTRRSVYRDPLPGAVWGPRLQNTTRESIKVRLIGSHPCSGRIELMYQGKWGTVCSQHWDQDNGFGVKMCKALGCKTFIAAVNMKASDADIIWANYLHCGANSFHPWQCLTTQPQDNTCPSGQAIGIVCSASLDFRLSGGYSRCDGRVEARYNGEWGTVCKQNLDNRTANLICKTLKCGWSRFLSHSSITEHGGLPTVVTDMVCADSNGKPEHCQGKWGKSDCILPKPASLVCSEGIDPETMKIDVATVVSSVLVPLLLALLVALGFVLWRCWMSSKKRSFFRKPSEKIYDEIFGDTRDSDAKDANAMMRMQEMGGNTNPLNQMDSQKNMEGAADSDIEDERYDDAEVVIPLSRLPGQQDASGDGLHPEPKPVTEIKKPAPKEGHHEFEMIQLEP